MELSVISEACFSLTYVLYMYMSFIKKCSAITQMVEKVVLKQLLFVVNPMIVHQVRSLVTAY